MQHLGYSKFSQLGKLSFIHTNPLQKRMLRPSPPIWPEPGAVQSLSISTRVESCGHSAESWSKETELNLVCSWKSTYSKSISIHLTLIWAHEWKDGSEWPKDGSEWPREQRRAPSPDRGRCNGDVCWKGISRRPRSRSHTQGPLPTEGGTAPPCVHFPCLHGSLQFLQTDSFSTLLVRGIFPSGEGHSGIL